MQSVETVGNSEGTATTETSQTPSCRALAGLKSENAIFIFKFILVFKK